MAMISHDGEPVAFVGATRAYLAPSLEDADAGDPLRRFVAGMCLYALDVAAGRLPGPYTDANAERFARCVLIDSTEFARRQHEPDQRLAARFNLPVKQITAWRRDQPGTRRLVSAERCFRAGRGLRISRP